MDHLSDVREFLRTRRDRVSPTQAGIAGGSNRRVPGLRREEVAFLAGVSVDYYARLERGNLAGVSNDVLAAVAAVLRLDEAETNYLHDLAEAAQPRPPRHARGPKDATAVRPSLQRFLDSITGSAVWIRDERMDLIATNTLGRAVYSPVLEDPHSRGGNNALFTFLSPAARTYYSEWEQGADDLVASLRMYAGRHPRDRNLSDLVGELTTRSDDFQRRWASHNVRHHRAGTKRIHHPAVGDLALSYEAFSLPDHPSWTMFAFVADPTGPTAERLALLGSLAVPSVTEAPHPRAADR